MRFIPIWRDSLRFILIRSTVSTASHPDTPRFFLIHFGSFWFDSIRFISIRSIYNTSFLPIASDSFRLDPFRLIKIHLKRDRHSKRNRVDDPLTACVFFFCCKNAAITQLCNNYKCVLGAGCVPSTYVRVRYRPDESGLFKHMWMAMTDWMDLSVLSWPIGHHHRLTHARAADWLTIVPINTSYPHAHTRLALLYITHAYHLIRNPHLSDDIPLND